MWGELLLSIIESQTLIDQTSSISDDWIELVSYNNITNNQRIIAHLQAAKFGLIVFSELQKIALTCINFQVSVKSHYTPAEFVAIYKKLAKQPTDISRARHCFTSVRCACLLESDKGQNTMDIPRMIEIVLILFSSYTTNSFSWNWAIFLSFHQLFVLSPNLYMFGSPHHNNNSRACSRITDKKPAIHFQLEEKLFIFMREFVTFMQIPHHGRLIRLCYVSLLAAASDRWHTHLGDARTRCAYYNHIALTRQKVVFRVRVSSSEPLTRCTSWQEHFMKFGVNRGSDPREWLIWAGKSSEGETFI